ncbi:flagellar basal body protein [Phenylobacterium sp. LjRoot219]|uniref:flagellar basal body protein n=1 Tax=Phenylobacterium sp. LjRoot219 TaxID=3342283 RepID=UPI003ECCCFB3
MALAAHDATDRVEQLIILTERLTDVVAQQAHCFEAHRPQDAAALTEEASRLANLYRHESGRVRADPGLVTAAPSDRRRALVRATEAFDVELARHGRAVMAAKFITEGLVRSIAEEVASQREQLSGYGPGARIPASAYGAAATAITLNQRA